jgi:glycosyltransferase involved in cell wall biosynthesis
VLNYEFPPIGGGGAPVSYEIAKRYAHKGHTVDVVTSHFTDLPLVEVLDGLRVYRVRCRRRRKELSHPHELLSFIYSAKQFLNSHLQHNVYDVCHAHFLLPTGLLALYLRQRYGLPYIISAHGSDIPGYNTDRFRFLHLFTAPLLKRICDGAERVVISSNYLTGLIKKKIYPYPSSKILEIPNGIDPAKFVPRKKEKIVMSSGRFLPRKGFQYLIRAVSDMDIGFEVHLCGDGPMREHLERLSRHAQTRIIFHGWIDNDSLFYRDLLGAASIFALLSTRENASVALLEGMSAGCAVLTSNTSGCLETVATSGVIVDPTDRDSIKASLMVLTSDAVLRQQLQHSARQRVEHVFAWDRIVDLYEVCALMPAIRCQTAYRLPTAETM